jgi:signal transduction histidine kinase
MNIPRSASRLDAWERREAGALRAIPYYLLAVSLVLAAVGQAKDPTDILVDTGLSAAAFAWMLWMVTLHPSWRERTRLMGGYFGGLVVLLAALVVHASAFGLFAWGGYLHAAGLLRGRVQLAGIGAIAVVSATSEVGGRPAGDARGLVFYAFLILINWAIASTLTWFALVGDTQSEERLQAIDELSAVNRRLEETLAENAGLQAQLLAQAREAGVLDERARMARELHDTLAQGITGIVTQLEAARQAYPEPGHRHLDAALRLARHSLSEARRSVHALRPEPLLGARLPAAIAGVADRWSALSGIAAQVTTTGTVHPMTHPDVEVALLRTAQEALANVASHARATKVVVTLSYMADVVALDVRDDGVGFDPGEPPAHRDGGGFGLTAMRQRVRGLAGTLEIESEPGRGTAVSACLPALAAGQVT